MDKICQHKDCRENKIAFSEYCWEHIGNKEGYIKNLLDEAKKGASFSGLNFSKVVLRNMELSRADFSNASLIRADILGSNLFDANLKGAELLGANLSGSDLTSANLEGAELTKANLFGCRLWHANLKGANLTEANLSSADFWNAKLHDIKIWHTDLTNASSLSKQNFAYVKNRFITLHRINEKGVLSAVDAYRSLKRHFLSKGKYDDASWASFKEKNMEKNLLKKNRDLAYIPSAIMNLLCGYGEKPYRIMLSSFAVIFSYALIYSLFNAVRMVEAESYNPTIVDYIYYSAITFTTVGYGDFIPKANGFFRILAASEAFTGAFMVGLFIFTLARKYSAR